MVETCLLCGGALSPTLSAVTDTRFGVPGEWSIAACRACGLEQTLPRPTGEELGRLYAAHYNFGGERGSAYTRLRQIFLSSVLYRQWLWVDGDISFHIRRAPAGGGARLIDIGCNEGRGLGLYAASGFAEVEGLETNPVAAAAARRGGFAIHEMELADFRPDRPFDVAVLSNVLEHALDPVAMLADVKRILKPGGQVWISCPNARSWARRLFGAAWINWHVPFHISHFHRASLEETIARAGFAMVDYAQATPGLWVAHSIIAKLAARPGQPTRALRKPLLVMALMGLSRGLLFPLLWAGNRLGVGDCHLAVARATPAGEE